MLLKFLSNCCGGEPEYDSLLVASAFPIVNDVNSFLKYVQAAKDDDYLAAIKRKLVKLKFVDPVTNSLTVGTNPFNVFARFAAGKIDPVPQTDMLFQDEFMVCHNLPENDQKWNDESHSAAAMAGPDAGGPGHVFITIKDLNWRLFNVASLVFFPEALSVLVRLKRVAEYYAKRRGWGNAGMYFHCYPHSSVNSLHLHVVNLDNTGWNFKKNAFKNLPIDDVISVAHILSLD